MAAKKPKWVVTITVRGPKPDVRTLGGDTVFLTLVAGQTAAWTVKRVS